MPFNLAEQLETNGFAIIPDVMLCDDLYQYRDAIDIALKENKSSERAPGLRNVFETIPLSRNFAHSPALRQLLKSVLGANYFAVRALVFDKNPDGATGANWKVPFHQDLTIAVREKLDTPHFSAWSVKAGVPHVQPPIELLENMLTVRLHLDDCDADNGALRVLPGSHQLGRLDAASIQQLRQVQKEEVCAVSEGGVLIMRPLILHASSPAQAPRRRRVLHLEFASEELPHKLDWRWRY